VPEELPKSAPLEFINLPWKFKILGTPVVAETFTSGRSVKIRTKIIKKLFLVVFFFIFVKKVFILFIPF